LYSPWLAVHSYELRWLYLRLVVISSKGLPSTCGLRPLHWRNRRVRLCSTGERINFPQQTSRHVAPTRASEINCLAHATLLELFGSSSCPRAGDDRQLQV